MTVDVVSSSKGGGPAAPTIRARAALTPLGHDAVRLGPGGLLGGWQERTLQVTIPAVLDRVEHGEAAANLARLLSATQEPFTGMVFTDSDVYKTLEAIAWASSGLAPGDQRLARAERLVELVERVQEADGYVNSWVQGSPDVERWSDPQGGHELYTAGHLFQAAVAASRTGVLPGLTPIATRFADLLVNCFGAQTSRYLEGHPQVETALVELYRVTGTQAYLDLARRQLDRRGHGWLGEDRFGSSYFQDAVPVREATEATGHAVRQVYLLTGAVDVAVETGDQELLAAAVRVWEEMAATKSYVTGALGSRHRDEAIGDRYELPPDRAYAETCAGIAAFQLDWRLLLATGEVRYADAMETLLYNGIGAATSTRGDRFFYSNPLQLRTGHHGDHQDAPTQRLPWFSCACCPPNLARLLASVHDYVLTTSPDGIQVQHPAAALAVIERPAGEVRLEVATGYPYDGAVRLVVATEPSTEWELALRIPAWCEDFQVTVDGRVQTVAAADGYARIRRDWQGRTVVLLELRMPIRRIQAHPRVDAVRGCVALARGPVVYAMEDADLPAGVVLEDVRLLAIGGVGLAGAPGTSDHPVPVLELTAAVELAGSDRLYTDLPYTDLPPSDPACSDPATCTAIPQLCTPFQISIGPYHCWANRAPGAMRVWIPSAPPQYCLQQPAPPDQHDPWSTTCFREETS
jgi:uncharacterized protein